MTTTTPHTPDTRAADHIVFCARIGAQRITLTAAQLRDTVASYLARGGHMPTPTDTNGADPNAPFHVITEEWLYGSVPGWVTSADVVQLAIYRHHAMTWIRTYFGPTFPDLEA